MGIFVTSDCHFGHNKPFLYEPRGFSSIEEHDAAIIDRWNQTVSANDTVYILGDLMLYDNQNGISCFRQLNGNKICLCGNHDTMARKYLYVQEHIIDSIDSMPYATVIESNKYRFYLSHYPTLTSNRNECSLHQKTINLCGHLHTQDKFADWDKGIIYHCELDAHNCYPVSLDTIIKDIKDKYSEKET